MPQPRALKRLAKDQDALDAELSKLDKQIREKLGPKWDDLLKLADASGGNENRRKAFVLLYAHLLRLPITNTTLQKG